MIQIHDNTRIYVLAPPTVASGGPELLHQLAHKLDKLGFDVAIYYYPNNVENPVNANFAKYNCKYVTELEDKPEHVIILPEVFFFVAKEFKHIRKCAWWLSVDNLFTSRIAVPRYYRVLKKLKLFSIYKLATLFGRIKGKFTYHLAQSVYAIDFLKRWGMEGEYLSDYLNDIFLKQSRERIPVEKKPQVLYNPLKGLEFTQKIMAAMPDINWVPLQNLTPAQVGDLLHESMVYIDFGNHPGKDRFPREAAIYKCCVITGRRGSAAFQEDVPIPDQYKIGDKEEDIPAITQMIRSCLTDYERHIVDFEGYREWIYKEEEGFEEDIRNIFRKG